jgi:hypothetical protein
MNGPFSRFLDAAADLAERTVADPDRSHRRCALHDSNGQRGGIEPALQAGGIAGELDPCDTSGIAADTRIGNSRIATHEDRQEWLLHRFRDAGQAGAQPFAANCCDRPA